ncbi:beta-ketoacyl synthase N-terminal-like domain-containing protein [Rivibacter subsaxonicus]|uniref:Beta-ketoacyl synthase-like protein n=1 Tax=Rivibacter subsaxonicus TaxID=457575 RepID=A0A4Q7VGE1_9BURK|nr:beta-ketoacyl synthase N-terminal-like domain-containing protein [Rivibacter subsaxonicus]RZT95090.1 beta-ketoacyl synthase-like protein [Rivibacter subsaxonicus]
MSFAAGLQAHATSHFDAPLEREAIEAIAPALAPLFEREGAPAHRSGLYLATSDAGAATSLRFWSEARRTGLALANPELFPWCLANAPCGALARRFGVTGPNLSVLGQADALLAAFDAALDALASERIDIAIVVALVMAADPQDGEPPGYCVGARLERAPAAVMLSFASVASIPVATTLRRAAQALAEAAAGGPAALIVDGGRALRVGPALA